MMHLVTNICVPVSVHLPYRLQTIAICTFSIFDHFDISRSYNWNEAFDYSDIWYTGHVMKYAYIFFYILAPVNFLS